MGAEDAGHFGHGTCLVDPVPGRLGDDDVEGARGDRDLLCVALDCLELGGRCSQDGAHAVVGFDGGDVGDALDEQPGQDAGAGPDFEDVGGILGEEEVECLRGRARAEAVVVVSDRSEGLAEDGGVLVLSISAI